MNSVNMLMNTLKVEVPKKESGSIKSSAKNDFNEILGKTIDNNSNKSTKDVYKENLEQSIDSKNQSTSSKNEDYTKSKLEDESSKEKLDEVKDESDDYNKIMDMLAYLNIIMKNNAQDLSKMSNGELIKEGIDIDLKNIGSSHLDMLSMLSSNEELNALLNNLDDENQKFLLMLKLMTSSNMDDLEKYLRENLNLSQQEIDEIMKSVELQKVLEKLMKAFSGDNEILSENKSSSVKDVFETLNKPVEGNEKLESNLSSLLDEEGEEVSASTKEETLLKNIMNGSSGIKNFNIREIALNQSSKISEQPMIRQGNFAEDVIKSIRYMDINNLKELTVKVVPKELGELVIKLTIESGIMKANLNATNKEAYELLSSNFKDISDKLQNNNIKIGEVNINLYEDDTTFFSDDSRKGSFNQEEKNKRSYKFQSEEELVSESESVDKSYLSYFV